MKKIFILIAMGVFVTLMSCTDKPAEATKEVIVVPAAPVIIVKDPPEKTTTVTLDKNGVKVSTKKVAVEVKQ